LIAQIRSGIRSGIVEVFNDDNICMARSVALGLVRALYGEKEMKRVLNDPDGLQKQLALLLLKGSGISTTLKTYNLIHLRKIQNLLNAKFPGKFRLAVFSAEKMFKLVYLGKKRANFTIPLLFHGLHFDLVTNPRKLFQVLN